MKNLMKGVMATILLALMPITSASAATLTPGSGWQPFSFGGDGSSWSTTFDVTISETSTLFVTDAFLSGDIFDVYADGSLLGSTSFTSDSGSQAGSDYDAAFASDKWSSGSWVLAAGSYVISGITTTSPFGSGGAALKLETGGELSPVPVPAAAWLFGTALLGLIGIRRKKLKAA